MHSDSLFPHRYVLDQILSGENAEDVVENIHEYLTTISQNIRAGQIKMEDFIINKVCLESLYLVPKDLRWFLAIG